MPLLKLSATEAFANSQVPGAAWPRKEAEQSERLTPLARPLFSPSFQFDQNKSIFTIGSCFARNIEEQLRVEGYNTAAAKFFIPHELQDSSGIQSILNRFVCYSILNEFKWAIDPSASYPMESIVEVRRDKWFDLNNVHEIHPSPRDRAVQRRRLITEYMKQVADADVIVMTLGLAEAWFDNATKSYINIGPHRSIREADPARFEFHLLDYNDILQALEEIHALLRRFSNKDFRILITVSPVALGVSYAGRDALIGNTYSKAVQRAAVEAFVREHENVDYFPSFESVTLSDRRRAWRADQAHASDEIVRLNVLRMIRAYGLNKPDEAAVEASEGAFALLEDAKAAEQAADYEAAQSAFAAAVELAPDELLIRFQFARLLIKLRRFDLALPHTEKLAFSAFPPLGSTFMLGQAQHGSGDTEASYPTLLKALEEQPTRIGLLNLLAQVCERLGLHEEALKHLDNLLAITPESHPIYSGARVNRDRLSSAFV